MIYKQNTPCMQLNPHLLRLKEKRQIYVHYETYYFSRIHPMDGCICPILAQNSSIKGKIISNQQPVEYANVTVNTADTTFIAGSVTDANGNFSLPNIPSGNYLLKVACMGYQTTYHPFKNSTSSTDLGKIPMKFTSITMNEVVVKAPMIKREADRFIVDVANSVAAIGKDGAELLQQAPGVWIN